MRRVAVMAPVAVLMLWVPVLWGSVMTLVTPAGWGEGLIVDGGCLLGPYGKGRSGMAPRKFSQELKDEICREIVSKSRPIAQVAKEHGLKDQTVGNWVRAYRAAHAGEEPELTVSERARLRELERDNRELRMELEFLGKATAFFAKKYR